MCWPNLMYYLGTCLQLLTVSTHNSARPSGLLTGTVILDVQNKKTECICTDRDGCEVSSPSRATWSIGHLGGKVYVHLTRNLSVLHREWQVLIQRSGHAESAECQFTDSFLLRLQEIKSQSSRFVQVVGGVGSSSSSSSRNRKCKCDDLQLFLYLQKRDEI